MNSLPKACNRILWSYPKVPNRYTPTNMTRTRFFHSGKSELPQTKTSPKFTTPILIIGAGALGIMFGDSLRKSFEDSGAIGLVNASSPINSSPSDDPKETATQPTTLLMEDAIEQSRDLVQRIKDEVGAPGVVVAVSVDGKTVWSEGLGYADIENRVPCTSDTVMRIASISKPITATIVGRLIQEGKLDVDKSIHEYVSKEVWPDKTYNDEKVTITTKHLTSHTSGVRHYKKDCGKKKNDDKTEESDKNKKGAKHNSNPVDGKSKSEIDQKEYYIKDHFKSVSDAISLFRDDPLRSKPGTEYLYTTHGYTLLSAVIEGASGKKMPALLTDLLKELGMNSSYLDLNEPLIYNRSKNYIKSKKGRLINAPYVDCSYKWAGGGLLSTAPDLVKFGNVMLYSYQNNDSKNTTPGYLRTETVRLLWTPVRLAKCDWDADGGYGMGWGVVHAGQRHGACRERRFYVSHTGGAIGASSAFLVMPREGATTDDAAQPPRGIVVAMITNMQSVGLSRTAMKVAKLFDQVNCD